MTLKDPKGGLTAAGRRKYARETGAKLRPGVKGPAQKPNGEPTRLALSAAAWGEPVPKTRGAMLRLAAKGRALLRRYEATKEE